MNIRLIAMDLDGTTLRADRLTMSPELLKTLKAAHKKGVLVVPVTGRPYRLLPSVLLHHPVWESHGVLCNGAQIRDLRTGRVEASFPLEEARLRQVLRIAENYDLPVEFNADGRLYLTRKTLVQELKEPKLVFHCTVLIPKSGILVEDLKTCCQMDVEKVHINCIPPEVQAPLEQALRELDVSVVCEKPPNLEVTHRQATKGQGLELLCSRLGIPMEQVMAIGDGGNDLTMLEAAGLSVAMGSSPDFIKAAADYVTGTNQENGAAAAISRFVLNS